MECNLILSWAGPELAAELALEAWPELVAAESPESGVWPEFEEEEKELVVSLGLPLEGLKLGVLHKFP